MICRVALMNKLRCLSRPPLGSGLTTLPVAALPYLTTPPNSSLQDLVMSFEAEGGEFKLVCDPKSLLCEWPPSAARNARCALHALATLLWPAVLALNNHSFPAS